MESKGRGTGIRLGDVVTTGAAATTLAAGLVGWIDWLTVPSDHPVRRPATIHGLINTTALVALAGAVPTRRRRLKLLAAAQLAILVGAWIGGDLVFRHGWRVRPAEEAEIVEQRLRDDPAAVARLPTLAETWPISNARRRSCRPPDADRGDPPAHPGPKPDNRL